jgi:predicted transposase YdaD
LNASPFLTSEEIQTMLANMVPLEQTRAYQEIFAKGKTEGETKGRTEGRTEGEAKSKADSLKRLLTRRFGALPRWALQRLDTG